MPTRPADDRLDPRASPAAPRRVFGVLFVVCAVGCIAASDLCAKLLSERHGVVEIVFVRALLGGAALGLVAARGLFGGRALRRPRVGDLRLQLLRGALATAAIGLFIWGLAAAPFANAVAVSATAPLFMALFGRALLGERVPVLVWPGLALGGVGVLLILRPDAPAAEIWPYAAILASGACYALVSVITRLQTDAVAAETTAALTYAITALVAGGALLALGWEGPVLEDGPLFAALGAAGAAGMFAYARAYAYAGVSDLAAWDNMIFPWALLFGFLAFAELPEPPALLGGALILLGGVLASLRRQRPVMD